MTLRISKVFTYDEDAGNYIQAVEAADGQVLEGATRKAINNFVIGCKQDGIWNAIKASCILAGARTLAGSLVPLKGAAPTNVNFVSGDYNRKTGLIGNGSSKYINTNRAENADPLSNMSWSVFATSIGGINQGLIGTKFANNTSLSGLYRNLDGNSIIRNRCINNAGETLTANLQPNTLAGTSRSASSSYSFRHNGTTGTITATELIPKSDNFFVFAENLGGYSTARIAFYHIGESLNLTLLDARVTDLINALGVAIP